MTAGFRGEGIFLSGTLADSQTVSKGSPAAFDTDGGRWRPDYLRIQVAK